MRLNFGTLFQKFSKDRTMDGLISIPEDHNNWPEEWKKVQFKSYTQHPKIELPKAHVDIALGIAITNRHSVKKWSSEPLTLQDYSNMLFYSCGTIHKALDPSASQRAQASAGKRYPLEVYIINLRVGDLKQCVYHYNPESHTLDELWDLSYFDTTTITNAFGPIWARDAGCAIVITSIVDRTVSKYGERGYRYMYFEAGAVAHMIHTIGSNNGLASICVGGIDETHIEKILDIDGGFETVLNGIFIGKV